MSYREHDWAGEEQAKWDIFVEERTLDYLDRLVSAACDEAEKHGKIFLVFDDKFSDEATMFADHIESLSDFPTESVIVCIEADYADPDNYREDISRADYFKVFIDFGPDLDPDSNFDPPEPW